MIVSQNFDLTPQFNLLTVIEPQCIGTEHAAVNLEILSLFTDALRPNQVIMVADHCHLELIKNKFPRLDIAKRYQSLPNGLRFRRNALTRLIYEFLLVYKALKTSGIRNRHMAYLFTSASRYTLLFAKLLNLVTRSQIYVIAHGVLNSLDSERLNIILNPLRLSWQIQNLLDKKITLIANAKYIKTNIEEAIGEKNNFIISIDFSFSKVIESLATKKIKKSDEAINLTYLGVGSKSKGTDIFFKLADQLGSENLSSLKFVYGGEIKDTNFNFNDRVEMHGVHEMLSESKYEFLLLSADALLLPYPRDSYRFGLSGVFTDALMTATPIICKKSQMTQYIVGEFGDFGWQFSSDNEIFEFLKSLSKDDILKKRSVVFENSLRFKANYSIEARVAKLRSYIGHK